MIDKPKHPGGRPRILDSVENAQMLIDEYFEGDGKKTICGLALALNFCDRQSLYDYRDRGDEFSGVIKKAMLRVENEYERNLHNNNAAGSIFALKNMKWSDKQELEHSGSVGLPPITIEIKDK